MHMRVDFHANRSLSRFSMSVPVSFCISSTQPTTTWSFKSTKQHPFFTEVQYVTPWQPILPRSWSSNFFRCLAQIARGRPLISLLENVVGMLRVWKKAGYPNFFWKNNNFKLNIMVLRCFEQFLFLEQAEKAFQRLAQYGYLYAKVTCPNTWSFLFDPQGCRTKHTLMGFFGCAKRRRIYILVIARKILRPEIDTNAKLEAVLKNTISQLKVKGPPPNAFLGKWWEGKKGMVWNIFIIFFYHGFGNLWCLAHPRQSLMFPRDHEMVQMDIATRMSKNKTGEEIDLTKGALAC